MMNNDNIVYSCDTCKREFPTLKSLYGHLRIHKSDKELERQLKKTRPGYSPGQGTSSSVDFGGYSQNALSNDKYLSLPRDPTEPISVINTIFTKDNNMPVCPDRNTSYGFSSGTPLVTHNHNHLNLLNFNRQGISVGPFNSGGDGSSRDFPYPWFSGGIAMAPPATPYRSLTQNTSDGSSSRDPLPSYRSNNSVEHSLGSANSKGSFSNNNNNSSSQGSLSLELSLGPSKSMSDSHNNSSSQGSLSLELSLGPSKSIGGSNNNSSAYPSLNGGVTGGLNTNMNMLVRPRVSRFHFHSHNPLDSILRNVPLSHPPPTTNLPDDKNTSGSTLIAKEKDKTVVLDDDVKDNVFIGDQ